jgi:hypothetical protein
MKTAAVGYFDENGNWQSDADKPVVMSTPAAATAKAEPTTSASGTMASNTATTGTAGARPARKHLPRTSSSLALFELISGFSIAGGIAIRQFRARVQ